MGYVGLYRVKGLGTFIANNADSNKNGDGHEMRGCIGISKQKWCAE